MVSRENAVILLFATVGLVLAYGGRVVTNVDDSILIGMLICIGVVAPQLLNNYLDTKDPN
ncbi:hypothetical protein [Haloarcula montana]|uniref:hypothetical protein n=1 Tax=Haloarcula montana TaxID=3111776 RepID=UPI002D765DEB|nr:hypothetical protein [Haloarcula sp. GH36]